MSQKLASFRDGRGSSGHVHAEVAGAADVIVLAVKGSVAETRSRRWRAAIAAQGGHRYDDPIPTARQSMACFLLRSLTDR
jgi:hypothetical protein